MPTKAQLTIAGLALAAIINDTKHKIEARKTAKLYLAATQAYEETQAQNEAQIKYLCHMMDEHDVPVNEFDLIALHFNQ